MQVSKCKSNADLSAILSIFPKVVIEFYADNNEHQCWIQQMDFPFVIPAFKKNQLQCFSNFRDISVDYGFAFVEKGELRKVEVSTNREYVQQQIKKWFQEKEDQVSSCNHS